MSSSVDTVLEVLGNAISRPQAERLLEDAGGDIETAIAAYFSGRAQSPTAGQGPEAQKISTLQSILGNGVPQGQLSDLLQRAGGSVEAAVNLYMDGGAGGAAGPHGAGGGAAGPRGAGGAAAGPRAAGGGGSAARRSGAGRVAAEAMDMVDSDAEGAAGAAAARRGPGPQRDAPRPNVGSPNSRARRAGAGGSGAGGNGSAAGGSAALGGAGAAARGAAAAAAGAGSAAGASAGGAGSAAPQPRQPAAAGSGGAAAQSSGAAAAGTGAAAAAGGSQRRDPGLPPLAPRPGEPRSAAAAGTGAGGGSGAAASEVNQARALAAPAAGSGPVAAAGPSGSGAAGGSGQGNGAGGPAAQPLRPLLSQEIRDQRLAAQALKAATRPLMDGDMLCSVKRKQGPYPVPPKLPLAKHRQPDRSLFVDNQDDVPGRSPPPKPLGSFNWPMRLGSVVAPLATEGNGSERNPAEHVPPDVQRSLLALALEWLEQGKLRYGNDIRWSSSHVGVAYLIPRGPGGQPQRRREGHSLALSVFSKQFLCFAADTFSNVPALRFVATAPTTTYLGAPNIVVATAPLGGPLERLAKHYAYPGNANQLNKVVMHGILVNVRLYGPDLDPVNGIPLKLDLKNQPVEQPVAAAAAADNSSDSDSEAEAGAKGAKAKAKQQQRKKAGGAAKSPAAGRKRARAGEDGDGSPGSGGKGAAGGRGKAMSEEEEEDQAAGGQARPRKKAKVAGGKAKPTGDAAGAPAAASNGNGARAAPAAPDHFQLRVEFFADQKALQRAAPSQDCNGSVHNAEAGGKKGRQEGPYQRDQADNLSVVIHTLLEYGSGLYVGPDCDGAINTGDVGLEPGGQAARGAGAADGAGPSTSRPARAQSVGPGESAGGAAASSGAGASGGAAAGGDNGEEQDSEGVADLDALLDSIQPPRDLPQAIAPPAVVAHPKPFQLQGLEWMLRRERRGDAVGRSLLLLHPAWAQVVVGSSGLVLHVHRLSPPYVSPDFFPAPVGGTCGGFLCDEMGLGKSLQTLMLISSNPPPPDWAAKPEPVTFSGASAALKSTGSGARKGNKAKAAAAAAAATATAGAGGSAAGGAGGSAAAPALPSLTALVDPPDEEPVPIATTLLVTPANLQEQWIEEIQRHMRPGSLKWAVYRGWEYSVPFTSFTSLSQACQWSAALLAAEQDASENVNEDDGGLRRRPVRSVRLQASLQPSLDSRGSAAAAGPKLLPPAIAMDGSGTPVPVHACQVVLVSYEVLRRELSLAGSQQMASRLLPRLGFWRIVLDEAQLVANNNSVAAGVASSLYRRHAWVVTGTPISSSLNEVQGLCEFLSYEPYYHGPVWRHLIQLPYGQRSAAGIATFRSLLRGVMLRRSKTAVEDQLALPPCTRQDLVVELSGVERAYYDVVRARFNTALGVVRSQAQAAGAGAGGEAGGSGSGAVAGSSGRGHGANRAAQDDSRRPNSNYQKAMSRLTELRQCCCHPHIVRREAEGAAATGARGAKSAAAGKGDDGGGRRSMRQIMAKLVSDAYVAYDQAVASLFAERLARAAMIDYKAGVAKGVNGGAGASTSSAAPTAAAGPAGGGAIVELVAAIQTMTDLVSEPGLLVQAKIRGPDGAVDMEKAAASAAFDGGNGGGLAGLAPLVAAEQAKERKRRWQRLQLDALMLRCYIACLHAPLGTMALLAVQARARVTAESRDAAAAKAERAVGILTSRTAGHAAAQAGAERVQQEYEQRVAAGLAPPPLAESKKGKGKAAAPEDPELKKAVSKLVAAAKTLADAEKAEKSLRGTAAVAVELAAQAADEAAKATAEAPPEVAEAAAAVQKLNDEINDFRLEMGMEPLDLTLADVELRRSGRQEAEGAAGGEAGPSGFASASGAAAAAAAVGETGGGDDDGDQKDEEEDDDYGGCSDDDDDDKGGRRRKRTRRKSDLVGGSRRGKGGNKRKSGDGGGGSGTAGKLVTLGASPYQEALFRSELAVRNFQQLTGRKPPRGGDGAAAAAAAAASAVSAEEAKLLQAVRDKWHPLQHLINQQRSLGYADDLPMEPGQGADAGPSGSGAGPSGSGAGPSGSGSAATAANPQGLGQGGAAAAAAAKDDAQEDQSCPICLDPPERRTITKCGHTFCTDCIHDIVQGKGTAPCPICRRQLTRADLFDSVPEEEVVDAEALAVAAAVAAAAAKRGGGAGGGGANDEYGAKVSALLAELARMTDEDPDSKALVFSSWGRLLRLVQEALVTNGVRCVSLLGANAEARQQALQSFLHDPGCRVLLLLKSTSGGAAGLTLTVAHTAFMMEPSMNPGLEAQAAARICRLGQDRPTRVVRIIAKDTVEERILALQQHKQLHGEAAGAEGGLQTESVDGGQLVRFFDRM